MTIVPMLVKRYDVVQLEQVHVPLQGGGGRGGGGGGGGGMRKMQYINKTLTCQSKFIAWHNTISFQISTITIMNSSSSSSSCSSSSSSSSSSALPNKKRRCFVGEHTAWHRQCRKQWCWRCTNLKRRRNEEGGGGGGGNSPHQLKTETIIL